MPNLRPRIAVGDQPTTPNLFGSESPTAETFIDPTTLDALPLAGGALPPRRIVLTSAGSGSPVLPLPDATGLANGTRTVELTVDGADGRHISLSSAGPIHGIAVADQPVVLDGQSLMTYRFTVVGGEWRVDQWLSGGADGEPGGVSQAELNRSVIVGVIWTTQNASLYKPGDKTILVDGVTPRWLAIDRGGELGAGDPTTNPNTSGSTGTANWLDTDPNSATGAAADITKAEVEAADAALGERIARRGHLYSEYAATAEAIALGSDIERLQALITKAEAAGGLRTVVLDRDIAFLDGDARIDLWANTTLVPDRPGRVIHADSRTTPLATLMRVRSGSRLGGLTLRVNEQVEEVVSSTNLAVKPVIQPAEIVGPAGARTLTGIGLLNATDADVSGVRIRNVATAVRILRGTRCHVHHNDIADYSNRAVFPFAASGDSTETCIADNVIGPPAFVAQEILVNGVTSICSRQPIGGNITGTSRHRGIRVLRNTITLPGTDHDGTPTGRATPSRSSADGLSLHGATDGEIAFNRVTGSGELAVNVSLNSTGNEIHHNTTENDGIGGINVGVQGDNAGTRNGGNRIYSNTVLRTCRNDLGQAVVSGLGALTLYASDGDEVYDNRATRHESANAAAIISLINHGGATNIREHGNEGEGFASHDFGLPLAAATGSGPLVTTWARRSRPTPEWSATLAAIPGELIAGGVVTDAGGTYALATDVRAERTGDQTATATIAVSAGLGSFGASQPANMIDGSRGTAAATAWAAAASVADVAGETITIDFGESLLTAALRSINNGAPLGGVWRLEGSVDSVAWDSLATATWVSNATWVAPENRTLYRYLRLIGVSGSLTNNYCEGLIPTIVSQLGVGADRPSAFDGTTLRSWRRTDRPPVFDAGGLAFAGIVLPPLIDQAASLDYALIVSGLAAGEGERTTRRLRPERRIVGGVDTLSWADERGAS